MAADRRDPRCSRREADRFIEQGNVFINGKRATIGDQVKPGDLVK
ncbi:S4 domain-containing protein, partial [Klebsiella pneumoniae]